MSIVDAFTQFLPIKRKQTPSGWISFNAPCCIHNGENADTRGRGGVKTTSEGGVSYHCFNCGFKASWNPGRNLSYKMRRLLTWLGAPDDVINKLAFEALQMRDSVASQESELAVPTFETVELPKGTRAIKDFDSIDSDELHSVIRYMSKRQLFLEDYPYSWSNEIGFKNRLIVPFLWEGKTVGYTARAINDAKPKYLTSSQPGYVFNMDNQRDRMYTIVVEGPFDALGIDGVAILGSEIKDTQALLINRLNTQPIVVPDRDDAGKKMVDAAIDLGWAVSMPDWAEHINDVNDAVLHYGRVYTLFTIVNSMTTSKLKAQLRAKKWFN
jgi:hypothetical protein